MAMSPRLLRPRAAGGFDPRRISGLELWLDAADSSSVTTVSGAASQWNDKSGLGRHATQTTANNRPSYSGTLNGRNVLTFDGTNDSMLTGLDVHAVLTGFVTMFVVGVPSSSWTNANANFRPPLYARGGATMGLSLFVDISQPGSPLTLCHTWRGAGFNAAGGPILTLGSPAIMTGWVNATTRRRRVNGSIGDGSANQTASDSGTFSQGANMGSQTFIHVGQDPTQLRWWNGTIAEVVVYSRTLTQSEIDQIEKTYLGRKWGITVA